MARIWLFTACVVVVLGMVKIGCVKTVRVGPAVSERTPRLVAIAEDVWVIEDHGSAVFYSGGLYWMYHRGGWSRSTNYDKGFVPAGEVPDVLRRVRDPHQFVRYRAKQGTEVRPLEPVEPANQHGKPSED